LGVKHSGGRQSCICGRIVDLLYISLYSHKCRRAKNTADRQTNGQAQRQTRSIQLQKTVKTVTEHTDDSRSIKIPQFLCQVWCYSSVYTCTENIPQSNCRSCISSRYSPNTHSYIQMFKWQVTTTILKLLR